MTNTWVPLIYIDENHYLVTVQSLTANVKPDIIFGENRTFYIRAFDNHDNLITGGIINVRIFYGTGAH